VIIAVIELVNCQADGFSALLRAVFEDAPPRASISSCDAKGANVRKGRPYSVACHAFFSMNFFSLASPE
jgi:hypothetical protein